MRRSSSCFVSLIPQRLNASIRTLLLHRNRSLSASSCGESDDNFLLNSEPTIETKTKPPPAKPIYLNFLQSESSNKQKNVVSSPSQATRLEKRRNAPQGKEEFLARQQKRLSLPTSDENIIELHKAYHDVIQSWATLKNKNALVRAEMWLEEMEKTVVYSSNNNLLLSTTNLPEAKPRLRKLQVQDEFKKIQIFHERKIPSFLDTYKLVFHGWAESNLKDSPIRAEYWLQHLLQIHRQRLAASLDEPNAPNGVNSYYDLTPDAELFSLVIRAWANSNSREATQKAQDWFQSWLDFEQQQKLILDPSKSSAAPSTPVISDNSKLVSLEVLRCWSRGSRVDAGEQAEQWMRKTYPRNTTSARPPLTLFPLLFEQHNEKVTEDVSPFSEIDVNLQPSIEAYSYVIDAYIHAQKRFKFNVKAPIAVNPKDLIISAERILMEMMRVHSSELRNDKKKFYEAFSSCFINVIAALCRVDLVERAEALVIRLEKYSLPNQEGFVTAYSAMLQCCQRNLFVSSGVRERNFCTQRLKRIYNRMIQQHDLLPLLPAIRCSAMHAFGEANRNSNSAPMKVIDIFQSVPSDKVCTADCNALINSWRLCSASSSIFEMETLIQKMKIEGEFAEAVCRPNSETYLSMILAVANSDSPESYIDSEFWLNELLCLGKSRIGVAESLLVLATIIRCCLRCSFTAVSSSGKEPPVNVALRAYEKMKGIGITPDYQTYIDLVTCIGSAQKKQGESDELILRVVQECIDEGKMHPNMIDQLQKIILPHNFHDFFNQAQVTGAWSRNIYKSS